ncbi:MAG: hypothetical protein JWO11_2253 [Nocardioides sp.]|nr:hypothetical protein [Nocardioides sp.]
MTLRIVRTFLIVRMVRGSLILLFLAIALVAVEVKSWPRGVAVAIAFAMVLQVGRLGASFLRYARDARDASQAPGAAASRRPRR